MPWELTAPCLAQQQLSLQASSAGSGSMGAAQVNHKSRWELKKCIQASLLQSSAQSQDQRLLGTRGRFHRQPDGHAAPVPSTRTRKAAPRVGAAPQGGSPPRGLKADQCLSHKPTSPFTLQPPANLCHQTQQPPET